jgi:hypothetical protein
MTYECDVMREEVAVAYFVGIRHDIQKETTKCMRA